MVIAKSTGGYSDAWKAKAIPAITDPKRVIFKKGVKPGKVLVLSDGSRWVIRNNYDRFPVGQQVYVTTQENPEDIHEFFFFTQGGSLEDGAFAQRHTMTADYQLAEWTKSLPVVRCFYDAQQHHDYYFKINYQIDLRLCRQLPRWWRE